MASVIKSVETVSFQVLLDEGNDAYNKLMKEARQVLRDELRSKKKGKLVGEVLRIPFADSYAEYMIAGTKPFTLIHLADGDAWSLPEYQIRGLRLTDAKAMVESARRMRELFESHKHEVAHCQGK